MGLVDTYTERTGGDTIAAATALGRDLMRGDPSVFKAGYDAENATLAVAELFGLDAAQTDEVRGRLK